MWYIQSCSPQTRDGTRNKLAQGALNTVRWITFSNCTAAFAHCDDASMGGRADSSTHRCMDIYLGMRLNRYSYWLIASVWTLPLPHYSVQTNLLIAGSW